MYRSVLEYMVYCWLILGFVRVMFYICAEKLEICEVKEDKYFKIDREITLTMLLLVNSIFIKCMLTDFSFAETDVAKAGIVMAINYLTPLWEIVNCTIMGIRGKYLIIMSGTLIIMTVGWLILTTSIM